MLKEKQEKLARRMSRKEKARKLKEPRASVTDAQARVMKMHEEIERAAQEGVTLYVPPKSPRQREKFGSAYEPRAADSQVINDWRQRMGSAAGKEIYQQRAATVETANANLKQHGLAQMTVRGLKKARCVALWCALAYNLTLFGQALIG